MGEVASSSSSSLRKGKERSESGELRSLSPELGDAIEGVLAAPKENPGEGSGPGMGDASARADSAKRWCSGRDARMTASYGVSGAGDAIAASRVWRESIERRRVVLYCGSTGATLRRAWWPWWPWPLTGG